MSVFTPAEIDFMNSHRLARIATVAPDNGPHVVPVSFRYNPELDTIDVSGHDFATRKKYRDVQRNPHVAIVVDDYAGVGRSRILEVRGSADVLPEGGERVTPADDPVPYGPHMFRITPERIFSWKIEPGFDPSGGPRTRRA